MRLRKLYIKGFKSFADETIINFDEQVIGVVGPNGSGKSNIIDAIRWVLGEQRSKDLRLDKMGDVIFNGTKKRKSSGVAQVALTFDNTKNILPTEYNEITISRLLYRSGDSEYRLNNVQCRLKDIHSLLIDTGIGSNSYAIIALGMVDEILSDKDNSRRKMFEQAAGVSKFKKRKNETMNKLKLTETDLNRIEDLLFELETNLKSLEKQAKRTQKFNEVKTDYKSTSILFSKRKINYQRESLLRLKEKKRIESDNYEKYNASSITLDAALQSMKANNIDHEKNLSELQKKLNELINDQRNLEYQKDLLVEKTNYNKKRLREIDDENVAKTDAEILIRSSVDKLKASKAELNTEYEEIGVKLTSAKSDNDKLQSSFDEMKSSFDSYTLQKVKANESLNQKKTEKAILEEQISSLHTERDNTEERLQFILQQLNSKEQKINTLKVDQDEKVEKLKQLSESKVKLNEEETELSQLIESKKADAIKINRKIDAKSNEVDLLQEMIENLEGYPESIKYLKSKWGQKVPLLSEVINPDDSIKIVLEQYLDPYLNYYVCDSLESASSAVTMLKDSQKGKANFFLLDQIDNSANSHSNNSDSRLKPVNEYVNCLPKYKPLINQLLGNAYIFEGSMRELNGLSNTSSDILSKSGVFIKTKKSLSGGSIGLFEGNKLGRQKKLEELKKDIKSLNVDLQKVESEIADLDKKRSELDGVSIDQSIQKVNDKLIICREELASLQAELNISKEQNAEWLNVVTKAKEAIDNKGKQLSLLDLELVQINEDLLVVENDNELSDGGLNAIAENLAKSTDKVNGLQIQYLKKEGEIKNVDLELEYNISQQEQLIEALNQNKSTVTSLSDENDASGKKIEELKQSLLSSYEKKKSFESTLTGVEQSYFQARGDINKKEDELKAIHRKISDCQSIINGFKDKEINIEFTVNSLFERLDLEFGITKDAIDLNDIPEDEERNLGELELAMNKLKSKFHSFGEVNPMALDAYEEMKLRYDNISEQRDDIVKSKESLIETIKEIEIKATDQYMAAFNQVKANFKDVFRSLFSDDDDCDLVLLEGDSPLNANIEIIAKPKGKKPKSLSQLSGGEKTLTATALLFALYLLKPAPFCIFDEVDAPLDDTNVQKFNKIVKKFSKDSQFIIVTHNKLTMAEVDTLYGVYMQEQGVSGLSQVDLRNYKYDPVLDTVAN